MITVTLYTRAGCHLCDDARAVLDLVRAEIPFTLDVVDIDSDPTLRKLYDHEVPVIAVGGRKAFKYRVTAEALRERLAREAQA
jgi:glutaredoxin